MTFFRKINKIVATRCHILRLKCTKFNFGSGSAQKKQGSLQHCPDTVAEFKGPTSKGREGRGGKEGGEGREGKGREGKRRDPLVLDYTPDVKSWITRSSADADNRLDAFSGQSRSINVVPFHMLHIVQ